MSCIGVLLGMSGSMKYSMGKPAPLCVPSSSSFVCYSKAGNKSGSNNCNLLYRDATAAYELHPMLFD